MKRQNSSLGLPTMALALCSAVCAQQAIRENTPLDQTRRDVRVAQEALINAHPNLERDLQNEPPKQLRLQIAERRQLAAKLVLAKAKYYEQMSGSSATDLDALQSLNLEDPNAMRPTIDAASASVRIMREQSASLQQQIDALKSKPNTGAEVAQLTKQLEVANEIVRLHESEVADARAVMDISSESRDRLKKLIESKKQGRDAYKQLLGLVRATGNQYNRYFDELDRIIDEREGKKSPTNNKEKR